MTAKRKNAGRAHEAPVALGISGASGVIYGVRLLDCLLSAGRQVHLVVSDAGRIVLKEELDLCARDLRGRGAVTLHGNKEIGAAIASGSFTVHGTVICPCSANTVGALAHGVGDSLITRIGAVALKERWPLIVVPRESPYSTPLLDNMRALSSYGARIIPASPSFYRRPVSVEELVDSVVDRVLAHLGMEAILPAWGGESERGNPDRN